MIATSKLVVGIITKTAGRGLHPELMRKTDSVTPRFVGIGWVI
jgi:hypothetical protein